MCVEPWLVCALAGGLSNGECLGGVGGGGAVILCASVSDELCFSRLTSFIAVDFILTPLGLESLTSFGSLEGSLKKSILDLFLEGL